MLETRKSPRPWLSLTSGVASRDDFPWLILWMSVLGKKKRITNFEVVGRFSHSQDFVLTNRIEVLAHHITNPLCEHVLLACCHDAGYVPVLRQYAEQQSSSRKITLIASGDVRPNIGGLSFQMTNCFEALFAGGDLVQSAKSYADVSAISPPNTFAKKTITLTNGPNAPGAPVQNCHRLRPILYNAAGKRVDKFLSVNEDLINELKKQNLCSWHYLRADCIQSGCKRNHERKRPLSPKHYDAIWYIARMGTCYTVKKGRNCEDDQCFYGHGFG